MTAVTKVKPTVKKAQQVKKVSNYKKIVLDTNSNLKKFTKSTGGSIKIILLLLILVNSLIILTYCPLQSL